MMKVPAMENFIMFLNPASSLPVARDVVASPSRPGATWWVILTITGILLVERAVAYENVVCTRYRIPPEANRAGFRTGSRPTSDEHLTGGTILKLPCRIIFHAGVQSDLYELAVDGSSTLRQRSNALIELICCLMNNVLPGDAVTSRHDCDAVDIELSLVIITASGIPYVAITIPEVHHAA